MDPEADLQRYSILYRSGQLGPLEAEFLANAAHIAGIEVLTRAAERRLRCPLSLPQIRSGHADGGVHQAQAVLRYARGAEWPLYGAFLVKKFNKGSASFFFHRFRCSI
jgi:hypothetical protein